MERHGEATDDELVVEVDGEGVHLATLDAATTLELAVAYVALLQAIADQRDESLRFVGLRAFEKCGSLATMPSDPELARQAAIDAHSILGSWAHPQRGLVTAVNRVRAARAALPTHYTAVAKVRGIERPIVAEPLSVLRETPYQTISVRAELVRVGGKTPRATFKSRAESRPFSVDLFDEDQATALGHWLYKTLDIVAAVVRDSAGNIEAGKLREFEPLADVDPVSAWRDWFREAGAQSLEVLERGPLGPGQGGNDDRS